MPLAPPGRHNSLDDWLRWLETLHPKKIDMSLNRIVTVLESLGIARPEYTVISVGGTNGKGSTVAFLESIYREAGLCVGAFTSPHLWAFNERIRIDGEAASDGELISLFEAIEAARGHVTLSYFECSAVAALLAFARRNVDVAVLEVGMGGRLDAVNAVDPHACVIASIGLDHMEWLGDDRESIGYEKAGIMRAGRPAIVSDPQPPASVLDEAARRGAMLYCSGRDYRFTAGDGDWQYEDNEGASMTLPMPGFGGSEQLPNAAACVRVVRALAGRHPVDADALGRGLVAARLAGRLDRRDMDGVEWWFDVAHNPQAVERLAAVLAESDAQGRTLAVFGAMVDKDIDGIVAPFARVFDAWFLTAVESERSAEPADVELALSRRGAGGSVRLCDGVADAVRLAREAARPGDRVIVYGSFYTVGPAMQLLGLLPASPGEGERIAS